MRTLLVCAEVALQVVGQLIVEIGAAVVWCGRMVLSAARWCGDRAREWEPRLWDRDEDPRSDAEERRP
ncbi:MULTISPECIES: hypothetical protein [Methylorubrum]|uniref:hypothetical protein n=1 Tax=Methylorubrum TaxID=2282523 RepID=UPI00209EFB98|nr:MULTISPECIES: hypothetical protein [Methylorubrum]MCP1550675.1 hypothetical protein [Methylorubrum zatmanii]MCP1552712.1 hypothetical protein [Methylorubrum extorquens]MCP1580978.1 hypothetical protein [Methylorubrum extorquens]